MIIYYFIILSFANWKIDAVNSPTIGPVKSLAHSYHYCKGFCSLCHNIVQFHEISMPTPWKVIGKSNFNGKYEAKLEFPEQWEGLKQKKTLPWEGCNRIKLLFSGTTQFVIHSVLVGLMKKLIYKFWLVWYCSSKIPLQLYGALSRILQKVYRNQQH